MTSWTDAELQAMRKHYPSSVRACLEHIPGRTLSAIRTRAKRMGLRHALHVTYAESESVDSAIRAVYSRPMGRGEVRKLARRLGRPRWWVSRRAVRLGLVLPRRIQQEAPWSDEEVEMLVESCHMQLENAARKFRLFGFSRTQAEISRKRRELDVTPQDNGKYNALQVSVLLGVSESRVACWCRAGLIRAEFGADRIWHIEERAIRAFALAHAVRIDPRKIPASSWPWFIDVVGGR